MRNTRTNRIILMGGLGNQLFQYAFALSLRLNEQINVILDPNFLSVRSNKLQLPELSSFHLFEKISLAPIRKEPKAIRRIMGLALRIHLEKPTLLRIFFGFTLRIFLTLIFSIRNLEITRIVIPPDNGYSKITNTRFSCVYVGYFQSYKYLDAYREKNSEFNLALSESIEILEKFKHLAVEERPLLVHIRLTDYRNEPNFGLLSSEYYSKSISRQLSTKRYEKIWLFSDEPKEALRYIPKQYHGLIRNISTEISGTLETFAVMRLAHGFVLANSSFSWWAARSAICQSPIVIFPTPWFARIPDPIDLCPAEWQAIER